MQLTPTDPPLAKTLQFTSTFENARQVETQILAEAQSLGFSEQDHFAIHMALHEALVNAVRHGNRLSAAKQVHVRYLLDSRHLEVTIKDDGPGFDHAALPDPTADENLEAPSGRGVLLMRAYMDTVVFNPAGNTVTMTKSRQAS